MADPRDVRRVVLLAVPWVQRVEQLADELAVQSVVRMAVATAAQWVAPTVVQRVVPMAD